MNILDATTDTSSTTDEGNPFVIEHSITHNTDWYVVGARYVATIRHYRGSRRWEVDAWTLHSKPLAFRTGKAARAYAESVVDALT